MDCSYFCCTISARIQKLHIKYFFLHKLEVPKLPTKTRNSPKML